MLTVNQPVPDFEALAFHEGKIKKEKLSDHRGRWVVVVFYPADFSFVCPTELEELAELHDKFTEAGADVLSVSTDTVWTHKAWHDISPSVRKVRFPMLSDNAGRISRLFGVYIEEGDLESEGQALRGSFLIDPDGVLKAYEIDDNAIGRSGKELFRKLQAAIFVRKNKGEVCPACWEPGKKTVKPDIDLVGKI